MLRSSLGFHTLTLFLPRTYAEMKQIMKDFQEYSDKTGFIKIFPVDNPRRTRRLVYDRGKGTIVKEVKRTYQIDYYQADQGIKWLIRYNNWAKDFQSYIIEVTINPKILGGIHDYVTAATFDDMEAAITNFNLISKSISPLLKHFGLYSLKRIDYCINFDLQDFMTDPNPELVMELIRRANIPSHFEELKKYDATSHRKQSDPASFYLMSDSLNINCYSKGTQLQRRSDERVEDGYPSLPDVTLDAARNVIRFEVQSKYRKTYALSNQATEDGNADINKYENLLSFTACYMIITGYFDKIVRKGNWYTLQAATQKIEACNFNRQKKKRLINALQLVNQCRGIAKTKASLNDRELEIFKKTLKDLSSLGINPVTIPKEWGVKHLPNLLRTYLDMRDKEING